MCSRRIGDWAVSPPTHNASSNASHRTSARSSCTPPYGQSDGRLGGRRFPLRLLTFRSNLKLQQREFADVARLAIAYFAKTSPSCFRPWSSSGWDYNFIWNLDTSWFCCGVTKDNLACLGSFDCSCPLSSRCLSDFDNGPSVDVASTEECLLEGNAERSNKVRVCSGFGVSH